MLIEATKCIWPGRMALQPGLTSKDHSKHTKRSLVLHPICSCGLPGDRQIKGLPGSLNWAEPLDLSMSLHLLHQHSQNQLWAKVALRSQWAEEGDLQGGNAPQVDTWLLTQWHWGWGWRRGWQRLGDTGDSAAGHEPPEVQCSNTHGAPEGFQSPWMKDNSTSCLRATSRDSRCCYSSSKQGRFSRLFQQ